MSLWEVLLAVAVVIAYFGTAIIYITTDWFD